MITIQQGESIQLIGRLLRRAKGATEYEVVEDLTPYGIEISMQKSYDKVEVSRFRLYKESSGFYTDTLDTSNLNVTTYAIAVAMLIDNVVIVANNTAKIKIEASSLGASIANTLVKPTPNEPSATTGTIDSGEWEYQIELASTGSDAQINGWSGGAESVILALGTIIKGADGDSTLNDEQLAKVVEQVVDEIKEGNDFADKSYVDKAIEDAINSSWEGEY